MKECQLLKRLSEYQNLADVFIPEPQVFQEFKNGLGLAIISTNKGVMSDIEARKNNIGGEIICRVFNV